MTLSEAKELKPGDHIIFDSRILRRRLHGTYTETYLEYIYMRLNGATADISISFDEISMLDLEEVKQ